jgi:hypothetical protein
MALLTRKFPGPWTYERIQRGCVVKDCRGVRVAHVFGYNARTCREHQGRVLTLREALVVAYVISKAPFIWALYRALQPADEPLDPEDVF